MSNIGSRLRVLHLEDNAFDQELVRFTLTDSGIVHQVFPVTTRAEFTDALDKGEFDVILSDSSLPGFSGEAALRMAKEKYPKMHFLFVTGHCPATRAINLIEAGAKAVISKSDLKSLADAMLAVLKIKQAAV